MIRMTHGWRQLVRNVAAQIICGEPVALIYSFITLHELKTNLLQFNTVLIVHNAK